MNLPEVKVRLDQFYEIINGSIQSRLLTAGIKLGVFTHLCDPKSAEEVAGTLGCHPDNIRRFLDGLTACKLITKAGGSYRNSATAGAVLVEGSPTYMGELLLMMIQVQEVPLDDLLELIAHGPPLSGQEHAMDHEATWVRYASAMANYQRAGLAQQAVRIVSNLPEFPDFKRMLDLGGGPGLVGIALTGAHPQMTGVIFDKPEVTRVAESFISDYGMTDRVTVMGGDFMSGSIGEGYDLVWASATLNFAGTELDTPVEKIFKALNPGGVFVSLADGLTCEGTEPAEFVMNTLTYSLMGQDMGIRQGAIADAMGRAGFSTITSRTVDTPMMAMDLDIARKNIMS